MSPALWLATRELAARRRRVALAAAVVATIAASVTTTELVARAREVAIAAQVEAIGPALTVVPRGTTPGDLARGDVHGVLRVHADDVERILGARVRAVERRVMQHRELAGARRLIVRVDAPAGSERQGVGDVAAVGSELGRSFPAGSSLTIDGHRYEVAQILPSAGSADDFSVFLPIEEAQRHEVNELRVYLAAGASPREAELQLGRGAPGGAVIRSDRGEVADGSLQDTLVRHRLAAYAVMAAVAALTLVVAAHLDAAERRAELATLAAIGASRRTLLGSVLSRSAIVAGVGSLAGALAGRLVAFGIDPALQVGARSAVGVVVVVAIAGALVGAAAAAPTALMAAGRDPARDLQES